MKAGFVTALGTPLNEHGRLEKESYTRHIEDQIAAGASGVLSMGTMGMLGCVPDSTYEDVVSTACTAVAGRVPLLVGVSDNSLARVRAKLDIVHRYAVDIAVLTAPYYFQMNDQTLESFFTQVAGMARTDVYLYDHLPITKHKITHAMVRRLQTVANIKGIKSGDLVLIKALHDDPEIRSDFQPVFSGSDLFAVADAYGIKHYLDGIFACFPKTIAQIQQAFDRGDNVGARRSLARMMGARDRMIAMGIWPAFTSAMNLLGYEGCFAPDYEMHLDEQHILTVRDLLAGCGEL